MSIKIYLGGDPWVAGAGWLHMTGGDRVSVWGYLQDEVGVWHHVEQSPSGVTCARRIGIPPDGILQKAFCKNTAALKVADGVELFEGVLESDLAAASLYSDVTKEELDKLWKEAYEEYLRLNDPDYEDDEDVTG